MPIDKNELMNRNWPKSAFPIGDEVVHRVDEFVPGAIRDDNGFYLIPKNGCKYVKKPSPEGYHFSYRVKDCDVELIPLDIEPEECAISSMVAGDGGELYGVTSGTKSHVFCYQPGSSIIRSIATIDEATEKSTIALAADGSIFVATKPCEGGGRIYRVKNESGIEEIACPVQGEGISAFVSDLAKQVFYGLSSVSGTFFVFDPSTGNVDSKGTVDSDGLFSEHLVVDNDGAVYGGRRWTAMFKYDPASGSLAELAVKAPSLAGREMYNRLDCLICNPADGMIYGGTSGDGVLFRFDPKSMKMISLGKPLNQPRIRCLTFAPSGCLYGIAGDKCCHLFKHDPQSGELRDMGVLYVDKPYAWHGYEFLSMATGSQGEIYAGESDRMSHLFKLAKLE